MKVVVAVDSFKDCLSSREISNIIEKNLRSIDRNVEVEKIIIADGGEGTVEALKESIDFTMIDCMVENPLGKKIKSQYGFLVNNKVAIIEMASASGLQLLNDKQRNPLYTSTYGTGELILDAINKGAKKIYLGLGGSSTNDCGLGMVQALGVKVYNELGEITRVRGKDLNTIKEIDVTGLKKELQQIEFIIICDVNNPLYGENGAAYIYGPQKGATFEIVKELDNGLRNICNILNDKFKINLNSVPGVGAAGGTGAGAYSFFNAKLNSGIDVILDFNNFEKKIENADLIITGEGRIDNQTINGKVISGIVKRAKSKKIIAIAGAVTLDAEELNRQGISCILSIQNSPITLKEALDKKKAEEMIAYNVKQLYNLINF